MHQEHTSSMKDLYDLTDTMGLSPLAKKRRVTRKRTTKIVEENTPIKSFITSTIQSKLSSLFKHVKQRDKFDHQSQFLIEDFLARWPEDREKLYENILIRPPDTCINEQEFIQKKLDYQKQRNIMKRKESLIQIRPSKENLLKQKNEKVISFYKKYQMMKNSKFAKQRLQEDVSMYLLASKHPKKAIADFLSLDGQRGYFQGLLADFEREVENATRYINRVVNTIS